MTPEELARALDYPYPAPLPPWIFAGHDVHRPGSPGFAALARDIRRDERVPVVAAGSNRAPVQLRRKFGTEDAFPVSTIRLRNVDTVYSAHFASYGAIPATLAPSPGTVLHTAVLWLTAAQLERMNESEALGVNYRLGWMARRSVSRRFGLTADRIAAYISLHGAVTCDAGAPVPVAGFRRRDGQGLALDQGGVHALAHPRVAPDEALHMHIAKLVGDKSVRERRRDMLKRNALPHDPAFWPEG